MAKTLEEVTELVVELKAAITEQLGETTKLIEAVNKLIDAQGTGQDLQPLFDELIEARDALVGDNAAVKEALDKVVPPEPTPPQA